jgi:hypothetical protein
MERTKPILFMADVPNLSDDRFASQNKLNAFCEPIQFLRNYLMH